MYAHRPFCWVVACQIAALTLVIPAASLNAQFVPAQGQAFDGTGAIAPPGIPFVETNWSLDAGCSPGLRINEGTRQTSAPNSLKMLRGGTGTRLVMDLNPGSGSSNIGAMQWTGNAEITRFFFAANAGAGQRLYRSWNILYPTTLLEPDTDDLSPGDPVPDPANFFQLSSNGGHMLYSADDGTNGVELWKAQAGTNFFTMQNLMIKDINPTGSSNPGGFSNAGDGTTSSIVFAADDGVAGRELWKSDGAIDGVLTTILVDINQTPDASASSNPEQLTQVGSGNTALTYFTADNGVNGRELWRSDGTLAGTGMLKDIVAGATGSNPTNLTSVTLVIATVDTPTLFFTVDSDGANGMELWKSNGALDGSDTVMVKDVGGAPAHLKSAGNLLFFINGNSLWMSDGTDPGTVVVQTFTSISGPMTNAGSTVYFAADDGGGAGVELWSSDGTTTSMVANINPGAASSSPASLFGIGSRVYFSADNGTNGRELFRTDTTLGAVMIKDINPGAGSSNPTQFANWADGDGNLVSVMFVADDGTHGAELWQTDGNATPAQLGMSHKWDLSAVIQSLDAGKIAVAGTDTNIFSAGCVIDNPTLGGGGNHLQAKQAVHQVSFLVEVTDGVDRAPVVITDVDCGDGSGFTRPRASLNGDGQPHKAIAAGLLAIMDQDPCNPNPDYPNFGPESPKVPLMEVPVIYDGMTWKAMNLANFPTMQSGILNLGNNLGNGALPPSLTQATVDPFGTKRFDTIRIDVMADSFRVLWHKRQGSNDEAPGDTVWIVTLPKQYNGAFRAMHIGTPSCTASPWKFFADGVVIFNGLFTTSLDPYGACCGSSGCTDVTEASQCTSGTFSPWKTCSEVLCCPNPWADADRDGDVDLDDFGPFQACYTGTAGGVPAGCSCFNINADGAIDNTDLDEFKECKTGPEIPYAGNPPAGCTPCAPPPAICPP